MSKNWILPNYVKKTEEKKEIGEEQFDDVITF